MAKRAHGWPGGCLTLQSENAIYLASRLSPLASRLSPLASRLLPLASLYLPLSTALIDG
jgi:hypothetical protein